MLVGPVARTPLEPEGSPGCSRHTVAAPLRPSLPLVAWCPSMKRYTCLISKLSCQQAKTTDLSTHAEKYSDHVDLLSPTPDNTHRLDHARLPGALTGAITLVCAPGTQPCDDSARAPPLLTAVAVLGILEAHQNIHTHSFKQHLSARSLSGIDCTFRTARVAAARACFPVVTCR